MTDHAFTAATSVVHASWQPAGIRGMARVMVPAMPTHGDLAEERSRCLVCGNSIANEQPVFQTHGLVVHLRCAMYRRRLLRR